MTIRAKLAINVISLVVSFLVIILVLTIASRRIDEATEKSIFANRLVIGVSDMNTITYDYVMNPSERARQQWERKHASLGKLIGSARFTTDDKRVILNRIRENHTDAAQFFKQILANNPKKMQATAVVRELLDESNERSVTQLMARSQLMISDAYALARVSYAEINRAQSWSFWLITAVILLSMLVVGAISYFLSRTINVSLRTLTKGTELIAGGNLDLRLPVKGKDVYLGMLLGEIPGLGARPHGRRPARRDRARGHGAGHAAPRPGSAVDVPTIALLFGLMVVSAQLRLGGFYAWLTRRIVAAPARARRAARRGASPWPARCRRCWRTTSSASRSRRCWSRAARAGGSIPCRSCWRSPARPTSARPRR